MTVESTSKPASRIADLDALRGLAALAVVLFHYTTRFEELYGHSAPLPVGVPWGHYGVQLFFGISGFVIFMTLDRTRSLADFAVSRASRLFPAYWTAMVLTTAAVAIAGMDHLLLGWGELAVNATMVQNFVGVRSVDGVYWTLSVELAFYCVMAALWRLRLLRRIEQVLLAWLSLKWLWTFSPVLLGVELSWLAGALLVQDYIPFFALGIAAYRLKCRAGHAGWPLAVIASALATIAACDGIIDLAVGMVTASALLVVALARVPLLGTAGPVWLGTVSYSLYLLHEFIGFALLRALEGAGISPLAAIAATIAAVLVLAASVTFLIERPALRAIRARYRGLHDRRIERVAVVAAE